MLEAVTENKERENGFKKAAKAIERLLSQGIPSVSRPLQRKERRRRKDLREEYEGVHKEGRENGADRNSRIDIRTGMRRVIRLLSF